MDTPENKASSVSATQELRALFDIDNNNRQAAWYNRFITCLPHAIFTSGEPEIIFNSSGFTYYNLEISETLLEGKRTITSYAIPGLIDTFLINEGVGIVIEARNPKQAIDLSYGDVLGFHLYRTFAEPEDHPFKTDQPHASIIHEGTDILISDVPEQILPTTSIKLLDAIIQHFGINDALVKLVYLPETNQHELVFSIDKNQYTPSKIQALLQKLGWFLPRYYSYLVCDLNNVSPAAETKI
ncbi:hypothetical protein [Legionella longbeachae]|uniref:Uncharacterized protein n=1 Tax=Legionella longbeachae serogroup 1 (strain NSW150) TaxID=661367 RepID=D3HSX1_LEGLN|nr:hypothetical protein [Legionella longbeachae]VEE02502.1 Uncharacterised protein [Legionella oakridgensis]HBD7398764.1 hypothetical protein [Legionella pneumophila]ARB91225.1 hypothetical protein A6J40_03040 [Legionella longbeachae]ARM32351.1 hypothetical protein B0B39_01850 [Legionella longbeachae]EEZ93377.1 hypothetical protein LLB_3886 [Legionella longbeachae D-4968]